MSEELRESYDRVAYPASPHPQTHPSRLAAISSLLGGRPPAAQRFRVLEIGCANGNNLIPMAALSPESQFVGLDLSPRQIQTGQQLVDRLGLMNIELRAEDFTDAANKLGSFDYIIAHGVYSWTPPAVAEALLDLCARHLSQQGIAYISYNTFPGWQVRSTLRELLHGRSEEGKVQPGQLLQTRQYLVGLREAAVAMPGAYPQLMLASIDAMLAHSDDYWFHDLLEVEQHPVSFQEFAHRLNGHGLRYIGDAEFHTMFGRGLPADVLGKVRTLASDRVEIEQLMDVLIYRSFRQSIIGLACKDLPAGIHSDPMKEMWITSLIEEKVAEDSSLTTFRSRRGLTFRERDRSVASAVTILTEIYPAAMPAAELFQKVNDQIGETFDSGELASALLRLFSYDALDVRTTSPVIATTLPERPVAFALARLQASDSATVTNLRHEQVTLSELERRAIQLLDGRVSTNELQSRVMSDWTADAGSQLVDCNLQNVLQNLCRKALIHG